MPGERSVAGEMAIGMRLRDVPELLARHVGLVKRNHVDFAYPLLATYTPATINATPITLKIDRGSEEQEIAKYGELQDEIDRHERISLRQFHSAHGSHPRKGCQKSRNSG